MDEVRDADTPEGTMDAETGSGAETGGELEGGPGGQSAEESKELQEALDNLNDRYLRLAAEFDNYRKRSRTELADSRALAQASLVGTLLDALDDFHRIVSVEPGSVTAESIHEGVTLVERKIRGALASAGLEEIDPVDEPFDPNIMEAMARAHAESEDEDEQVAEVFQRGFRFGGHLVRPARVSVRKYE